MVDDPSSNRSFFTHSDVWAGLVLFIIGVVAAWMASDFDDVSRPYPLALSIILAGLGLALVAKAASGYTKHVSFVRPAQVVIPCTIIIALWITALSKGLGYVLPTFFMELIFMLLCGIREPKRAALYAALISIVSYLIFIVALNVRIPTSIFPWLL